MWGRPVDLGPAVEPLLVKNTSFISGRFRWSIRIVLMWIVPERRGRRVGVVEEGVRNGMSLGDVPVRSYNPKT